MYCALHLKNIEEDVQKNSMHSVIEIDLSKGVDPKTKLPNAINIIELSREPV